ncbi:hypothetical protein PIB30_025754 [Stylosanthes scabra]|uniref:Uncharacterized protein n=1 Tax=Stylosanthes scabra TaxID=79078 RepID=A0ABU6RAH3_9FABA|nr:hypothetical protein [Stylosanthes scabra]
MNTEQNELSLLQAWAVTANPVGESLKKQAGGEPVKHSDAQVKQSLSRVQIPPGLVERIGPTPFAVPNGLTRGLWNSTFLLLVLLQSLTQLPLTITALSNSFTPIIATVVILFLGVAVLSSALESSFSYVVGESSGSFFLFTVSRAIFFFRLLVVMARGDVNAMPANVPEDMDWMEDVVLLSKSVVDEELLASFREAHAVCGTVSEESMYELVAPTSEERVCYYNLGHPAVWGSEFLSPSSNRTSCRKAELPLSSFIRTLGAS